MRIMLFAGLLAFAPSFASATTLCAVALSIHPNGSATFEGVLYTDRAALTARFADYKKHHGNCQPRFLADPGTGFAVLIDFARLSGARKIGFLTMPRNDLPAH